MSGFGIDVNAPIVKAMRYSLECPQVEVCGMLVRDAEGKGLWVPVANTFERPEHGFEMHPESMRQALLRDAGDLDKILVMSIFHSHPNKDVYGPSELDIQAFPTWLGISRAWVYTPTRDCKDEWENRSVMSDRAPAIAGTLVAYNAKERIVEMTGTLIGAGRL